MLVRANVFSVGHIEQKKVKKNQVHRSRFYNGQLWQWPENVCRVLASFTLVQRKRKGCDWSLSLACLVGPFLGMLFVCVPPAFCGRHGARWKLAGGPPFEFSPL